MQTLDLFGGCSLSIVVNHEKNWVKTAKEKAEVIPHNLERQSHH